MISIVDTDALIGLAKPDDPLHARAESVQEVLRRAESHFILSPTTMIEFSLVGLQRLGLSGVRQTLAVLLRGDMTIESVTDRDIKTAFALFERQTTKDNSFCDCIVMVLATRLHADCIFSFDRGYTKNGFVLAEEYIRNRKQRPRY
jgi:predicted nucleic acid-binding protein